jgi:hypothetical protein
MIVLVSADPLKQQKWRENKLSIKDELPHGFSLWNKKCHFIHCPLL